MQRVLIKQLPPHVYAGALAYAELGTMITSSGAEYSYFMVAFGAFPAYMFSWSVWFLNDVFHYFAVTVLAQIFPSHIRVSTIIIKPSQLAIICLSLAEYVAEAFTYECPPSGDILKVIGITTVGELEETSRGRELLQAPILLSVMVTLVNCISVKLATMVQNVFTACKMLAIFIIIGGGIYKLIDGQEKGLLMLEKDSRYMYVYAPKQAPQTSCSDRIQEFLLKPATLLW